jgi:hypothetical protein
MMSALLGMGFIRLSVPGAGARTSKEQAAPAAEL